MSSSVLACSLAAQSSLVDDPAPVLSASWTAPTESFRSPFDLDRPSCRPDDPWLPSALPAPPLQPCEPCDSPASLFLSAFTPPTSSFCLPDDEGQTVAGYVLGPVIGYGGFSTIRRASSPSGGVVAVKIIKRSALDRQSNPALARRRLDHETLVWSSLSHEHVLPLFTTEHTSYADFFLTLYCPAGSLFAILKRDGSPALPHDDAGMMFRQVVRGVRYLHQVAGYVHRDIKLENVLVDEMGVCRIGDFGLARRIGEADDDDLDDDEPLHRHRSTISHTHTRRGGLKPSLHRHTHSGRRHRISTPVGHPVSPPVHPAHAFPAGSLPYVAPELLAPSPSRRSICAYPSQDIWALGVLLYALLTGNLPFSDPFEPRLTVKILHGAFDMPDGIGRGADRVLRGCLERSVSDRWTIAMVDEVAWGIGWEDEVDESSAVPPDDDEFELVDYTPSSRSSSLLRSRCLDSDDGPTLLSRCLDSDGPTLLSRRSLSRASVTTTSSLSTRSTSRSVSRPPPMARLALSSSPQVLPLLASPSSNHTFERGRRPKREEERTSLTGRRASSSSSLLVPAITPSELARDLSPNVTEARWGGCLLDFDDARVSADVGVSGNVGMSGDSLDSQPVSKRSGSAPPTFTSTYASAWPRHKRGGAVVDGRMMSVPALARSAGSVGEVGSGGIGIRNGFGSVGRNDFGSVGRNDFGGSIGVKSGFLREPSATPNPIVRGRARQSRSVDVGCDADAVAIPRRG